MTGDIPVAAFPVLGGHEGAGGYDDMLEGRNIRGIIRYTDADR